MQDETRESPTRGPLPPADAPQSGLLRAVPFGVLSGGHAARAMWGAWTVVDGRAVLASGGDDGTTQFWDPARQVPLGPLPATSGPLAWGAWGVVDGRPVLATGSNDGTVALWDLGSPGPFHLMGHPGRAMWGAWTVVDGRPVLATGGDDGTMWFWDSTGPARPGQPMAGYSGPVLWGAWGVVDGRPVLATGGDDGRVRFWDSTGASRPGQPMAGYSGPVLWGAWGVVDGRPVLATGGGIQGSPLGASPSLGGVQLWDPARHVPLGEPMAGNIGPSGWGAWGVVDGRPVLAIGGGFRATAVLARVSIARVQLWDPARQVPLGEPMAGEAGGASWAAWGVVDGRPVLATGGGISSTVHLWDPTRQKPLGQPLAGHTSPALWGAWAVVDGRPVLATGGDDDGTVRLWEVIEDRPVGRRLPPYQSDASTPVDELDRRADATAVAELVTAHSARPPLAVGLFGDWGEGKTHFLGLLQQQVVAAARPGNPLACTAVRQVRFNAWHYAETDLWASLVTELFAQLATEATDEATEDEARRHSRLTAELVAARGLPQRMRAAQARRDELRAALAEPAGLWESLPEPQQQRLRDLAGDNPERLYAQAARTVAAMSYTSGAWWRLIRGVPLHTLVKFGGLVVLLAAAAGGALWGLPAVWKWLATAPGIAGLVLAGQLLGQFVAATRARASSAWAAAMRLVDQQRQRLQTLADTADAEVQALQREMQDFTAAGQLAGVVVDRDASSDYRSRLSMMSRIREDFSNMATLLARAAAEPSSDMEMTAGRLMVGDEAADLDAAGDGLPRIDRIIVHIDDLDRCPPRRVVEMLEAIHLLLAVPLFVVVVAVDPRWLLNAIATHYRDLFARPATDGEPGADHAVDPDNEELWQSTPTQYLEKIFQVVLTLPPLDTDGYQRLLRSLVGTREGEPTPETAHDTAVPLDSSAFDELLSAPSGGPEVIDVQAGMFGVEMPAARVVERVDPFTLHPDEIRLLDLLGPPHLLSTPRQVKRLANSYGLLTAMRRDLHATDLTAQPIDGHATIHPAYVPYRAGMVLLAALVAYPSLGPGLFVHLHDTANLPHTAVRQPLRTWSDFVDTLRPKGFVDEAERAGHAAAGRTNRGGMALTPVQAQHWQNLVAAFDHIAENAAAHGLPLPVPLSAWAEWIVPVGRLSFPTGRVVNGIDRLRPLQPTVPSPRSTLDPAD